MADLHGQILDMHLPSLHFYTVFRKILPNKPFGVSAPLGNPVAEVDPSGGCLLIDLDDGPPSVKIRMTPYVYLYPVADPRRDAPGARPPYGPKFS